MDEAERRRLQLRLEESSSAGNIQPRLSSGEASEASTRERKERIRSMADGRSTWARRCLAESSMISWRWAFTYPIASAFMPIRSFLRPGSFRSAQIEHRFVAPRSIPTFDAEMGTLNCPQLPD